MRYKKNYNKNNDSDYDDEIDSVMLDEDEEAHDKGADKGSDEEAGLIANDENALINNEENKGDDEHEHSDSIEAGSDDEEGYLKNKTSTKLDPRRIRMRMDPQSERCLENDLKEVKGLIGFKDSGLMSFNWFMHLFIIITRHSKEQFIKMQRIHLDTRRRAYRLKDWKTYEKIV